MESSVIITKRVINTINSLPQSDRAPISNALSMEFILGQNPDEILSPTQKLLYSVIRFYVSQDTERKAREAKIS